MKKVIESQFQRYEGLIYIALSFIIIGAMVALCFYYDNLAYVIEEAMSQLGKQANIDCIHNDVKGICLTQEVFEQLF